MADQDPIVICIRLTRPLQMPDNLIGICAECGETIQHRPHVPKEARKVCVECSVTTLAEMAGDGKLDLVITPDTASELEAIFKKRHN